MNNSEYEVQPFRFWCQKILPLVYDDSLSYYETLCKMGIKINELIDVINGYQQEYKDYVDNEIKKLTQYVDEKNNLVYDRIQAEVNAINAKHDKDVNDLLYQIQQLGFKIDITKSSLELSINELKRYVDEDQIKQNEYIKAMLNSFYKEINKLIEKYNLLIKDPTTGKENTIQDTINNIYHYLRYGAFDCIEHDGYDKTCEWWDTRQFTAKEFDINGAYRWGQRLCECHMVNPFTGIIDKVTNVINMIITKTNEALSANEYDNLNLTATYYDNKELTAYNYDFNGKMYLT